MSENKLEIVLPLKAVSMNQAYPSNKKGHRYLSEEGKIFKEAICYLLAGKIPWQANEKDEFEVRVNFYFKDNRRRDIDDYFKLFLDALTDARVWVDDRQVVLLTGEKKQGWDRDEIYLSIKKID